MESLPLETATQLCKEVQDAQFLKIFTQCWGCVTFSKGETAKICGEVVGCNLVLARYHRKSGQQVRI